MAVDAQVVFIRGVMGRSGTNYLQDLLLVHPRCGAAREPVHEDFFLDDAQLLVKYADSVSRRWRDHWLVPKREFHQELLQRFGDSLLGFLTQDSDRDLVLAKSPSAVGLEYFDRLFPTSPLILLVRDGRSVVQSAMRSFGWNFERATRSWLRGAREILAFEEANRHNAGSRHRLVRYEDLLSDAMGSLVDLCGFLGLDVDEVKPDDVANIPVRGSSTFGRQTTALGDEVHWKPVPNDGSFVPQQPGEGLTPSQQRRFDKLAGRELAALGYEPSTIFSAGPVEHVAQPWRTTSWWMSDRASMTRRAVRRRMDPELWYASTPGRARSRG